MIPGNIKFSNYCHIFSLSLKHLSNYFITNDANHLILITFKVSNEFKIVLKQQQKTVF